MSTQLEFIIGLSLVIIEILSIITVFGIHLLVLRYKKTR